MKLSAGLVCLLAVSACRSPALDANATAVTAVAAARRVSSPRDDSLAGPSSWDVDAHADSVPRADEVVRQARALLHARPATNADSARRHLTILAARRVGSALELRVDVATVQRCGPTWATRFGYSGEYIVQAHLLGVTWTIDSLRPLIYGDPSPCLTWPGETGPPAT
jgi:hypothetical protein